VTVLELERQRVSHHPGKSCHHHISFYAEVNMLHCKRYIDHYNCAASRIVKGRTRTKTELAADIAKGGKMRTGY
jgi:hypothetical protein